MSPNILSLLLIGQLIYWVILNPTNSPLRLSACETWYMRSIGTSMFITYFFVSNRNKIHIFFVGKGCFASAGKLGILLRFIVDQIYS